MATNRNGTVTALTERTCIGSLAAHLDKFAEFLASEGYVSQTIKDKCELVAPEELQILPFRSRNPRNV